MAFSEAEIVRVAQKLSSAPRLLVELGELMNDPNTDAKDVVSLLKQDPALIAQILRMANSAAYAAADRGYAIPGEEALLEPHAD